MATIPPQEPKAKYPAIPTNPSSSPDAEHKAAVTAYKEQSAFMGPTRKEYDVLFSRHKQTQTRYNMLMDEITSHQTTYQHHKQYSVSLSNALLASNTKLGSAPKPISDSQALTHATILNDLRLASNTLATMMLQTKRLDRAKDLCWTLDQELYAKCRELFKLVEKDCRELDRLHAKVLEAEKNMGEYPGCGMIDGNCLSCTRNAEREAKAVAAEKVAVEGKKAGIGKKWGGKLGKEQKGKQKLEDILEEGELGDCPNEWV